MPSGSVLSSKDRAELISIFRHKLKRLREIYDSSDQNDLIECAGILRDLLISDTNGLLGLITRNVPELRTKRSRRIEFKASHEANQYRRNRQSGVWFLGDGLEYHDEAPFQTKENRFTKEQFFALAVIDIEGKIFSVKDTILFVANKLGSRHFSRDKGEVNVDPLMYELHNQFTLDGMSPAVRTMGGIARVVYRACKDIDNRLSTLNY